MPNVASAAFVVLALLLAGCAGLPSSGLRDDHGPGDGTTAPPAVHPSGLRLLLRGYRAALVPGELAVVNATLENTGARTVTVPQGCGEPFHFRIHDAQGGEVAPYPQRGTCSGYQTLPLQPGERLVATFPWNGLLADRRSGASAGPAPPGTYHVRVAINLLGATPGLAQDVALRVEDPQAQPLALEVRPSKAVARPGDLLAVNVTVTNRGSTPVPYDGCLDHAFAVRAEWSNGTVPLYPYNNTWHLMGQCAGGSLAPGHQQTLAVHWNGHAEAGEQGAPHHGWRVSSGVYSLVAEFQGAKGAATVQMSYA